MSHQVLSRKYRPQGFDELVGQAHVGQILRNAIRSGRVGHAYLFVGPRGVGKTTTARIFAKALNCVGRPSADGTPAAETETADPCGTCASCRDIAAGADFDVVEMDAASNNHVEDVRRLREQVGYATVRSRHRIWIVDEVHMLSMPAFNAFLKTLEEPPDRVKFIFCTTEEHKLPDTFRSRCQRIEFRPIPEAAMADRLRDLAVRESVQVEDGLCEEIATAALGGLRDAESLLEQMIAACPDGHLRREDLDALAGRASPSLLGGLRDAILRGDAGAALEAIDAVLAAGCKPSVLLEQWMELLRRDLVRAARQEDGAPSLARVTASLDVLLQKRVHLRAGADGALVCQVAAVELARLPDARDLDRLIESLASAQTSASGPVSPPAPARARASAPAPRATATSPPRAQARAESPPTGAEALSPDRIADRWDDVITQAQEEDGRLAEALRRARPGAAADGRLEIFVPHGDVMVRSTLERRESVLRMRRILDATLGHALAPRLVEEPPDETPAPSTPSPEEHPTVRLVREKTGGRLLNLESDEPKDAETP